MGKKYLFNIFKYKNLLYENNYPISLSIDPSVFTGFLIYNRKLVTLNHMWKLVEIMIWDHVINFS